MNRYQKRLTTRVKDVLRMIERKNKIKPLPPLIRTTHCTFKQARKTIKILGLDEMCHPIESNSAVVGDQ